MSSKCGAKAANCKACKQVTCTNKTKCMKMRKGMDPGIKGMHMRPGMMGLKTGPGMKSGMTGKRMNPNMKKIPGKTLPVKK